MSALCWGGKVSLAFAGRIRQIADQIGVSADDLMACMAWESGRTFSSSVKNAAGSGAVGLIQFMPQTAAAMGTSVEALSSMSAEAQLDYVLRYFRPWAGKLHGLGDLYMAILWPAAIGKPDGYVLFDKADPAHPARYVQNAGLDFNHDGKVTKLEAYSRVARMRDLGFDPPPAAPAVRAAA